MSWIYADDGGYHLLCNRDEKRTRGRATGPSIAVQDDVRFVAPTDGDRGGTWILANEFGLSLCLLNGASVSPRLSSTSATHAVRSRGLLLLDQAAESSARKVSDRLSRLDLTAYAPFTLLALEPNRPATVVEWDGSKARAIQDADILMPLFSSSFDANAVCATRRKEFDRQVSLAGRLDATVLYAFHYSHGSGASAYSPCMHRSDASTVSFSWVKVSPAGIDFFYTPSAPCQWTLGDTVSLARNAAAQTMVAYCL